ncbi:MAG: hypothetical protein KDB31_03465 [Microthrixaceae bacterium]|nr:hypothetical protein [Microthrixaceae bacterium]
MAASDPRHPTATTAGWWIVSVAVALLHNGLWATPNLGFMSLIAGNPGSNPFPESLPGDYLLTSIAMPTLAALLGQTAAHEVARLHLVVLLVGWAAVVALAQHTRGHRVARLLTVVLAAAPIVTVSMQWLGQPDPLTAMCGVAIVLVRRRWSVVVLAVLAALAHPEQALFMVTGACVLRTVLPPAEHELAGSEPLPDLLGLRGFSEVLYGLAGVLLGRLGTQVWFWINGIVVVTPRSSFLDSGIATFWDHHARSPLLLLWSLWGPLWLFWAFAGFRLRSVLRDPGRAGPARRAAIVGTAVAAAALVPVFVTLDETRVYAVVTAGLLAFGAVWVAEITGPRVSVRAAALLLAVTAVLPGVMATGSSSSRADIDTAEMARFLLDGTVPREYREPDGDDLVTEWLIAPFDIVTQDPGG